MINYVNGDFGNTYEVDTNTGIIRNAQTGVQVTSEWAYPLKQTVLGGVPETHYFRSSAARDEYISKNKYCDKLPRRKVFSDCIE